MSQPESETSSRLRRTGVSTVNVKRIVEWGDKDAGHPNNLAIMGSAESAEAEMFRQLALLGYFPSWPPMQQAIDFRAKLWFDQGITTTVWAQALGDTCMTLDWEIRAQPTGERGSGTAADGPLVTAYGTPGATRTASSPAYFHAVSKPADQAS